MTSIDTNLLIYAADSRCANHGKAHAWVMSLRESVDVVISEFVLAEFYNALRNPTVFAHPLPAPDAFAMIQIYRKHPSWQVVGFPSNSQKFHDEFWALASQRAFPRSRLFDARLALSLRAHGVKKFATANVKDFQEFDFDRVWNPLNS